MKKVNIPSEKKEFIVGKIACVGKNYIEHARELGDAIPEKPVIFLKPSSSLIFSGEKIIYPEFSNSLHYETELVLLIGRTGKKIPREKALDYIAGYTIGLDMTLRDLQSQAKKQGHPWTISKCFDTATVIGEFLSPGKIVNPNSIELKLWVNGELKQYGNTANMIYSVEEIIEYLSFYFTLEEGDLVFTGTPEGVGEVRVGDKLVAEIPELVKLETEVIRD